MSIGLLTWGQTVAYKVLVNVRTRSFYDLNFIYVLFHQISSPYSELFKCIEIIPGIWAPHRITGHLYSWGQGLCSSWLANFRKQNKLGQTKEVCQAAWQMQQTQVETFRLYCLNFNYILLICLLRKRWDVLGGKYTVVNYTVIASTNLQAPICSPGEHT